MQCSRRWAKLARAGADDADEQPVPRNTAVELRLRSPGQPHWVFERISELQYHGASEGDKGVRTRIAVVDENS